MQAANPQVSSLGLPLPSRSASAVNLSGLQSGASTPATIAFSRSTSNLAQSASGTPVPPASPRAPYALTPSVANANNYDQRKIAQTINRIESNSGIGGVGNSVGGSTGGNAGATALAANENKGDAWTAVCIRTLPLLSVWHVHSTLRSILMHCFVQ